MVKFDSDFREKVASFALKHGFEVKYTAYDDGDLCTLVSRELVEFKFSELVDFLPYSPRVLHGTEIFFIFFYEDV